MKTAIQYSLSNSFYQNILTIRGCYKNDKKRKKYRFLFFGLIYKRGTLVKFSSTSVDFNIQYTMDPNNQLSTSKY